MVLSGEQQNRTAQFRTESSTVSRSSQHFSIKVSSESQPPLISKTWGKRCDNFIWNFLMLWWFNFIALPNSDQTEEKLGVVHYHEVTIFSSLWDRETWAQMFSAAVSIPQVFLVAELRTGVCWLQQFCWIEVNPAATDPGPDLSQGQSSSQLVCYSCRWK